MDIDLSISLSPGLHDSKMTQLMTSGSNLDTADTLDLDSLGHQGEKSTGGNNVNLRVLWCTHMNLSTNYEELFNTFKDFGRIERIKLKLTDDEMFFEGFVTFHDFKAAHSAHENYSGTSVESALYNTKLISSRNLQEEDSDFIPTLYMETGSIIQTPRQKPSPVWYVASYKEGRDNMVAGTKCLKRKFGFIPKGCIKKYGKGILIKADNKTQAAMMNNFRPLQEDIISKVVPHHSFNTLKGVVYSRDLFEFSVEEILEMCPATVYEVRKLSGKNGSILLYFNSRFLPDYIEVEHSRFKVKKYRHKPKQCFQCFEFGHITSSCRNTPRCPSCSGTHEKSESCGPVVCANCEGNHPPSSRECIRFRFEQEILEVAHNEFVSIGSAKRKVMGANQSPESSYASVLRKIKDKSNSTRSRSINQKVQSHTPLPVASQPSESVNTRAPSLDMLPIREKNCQVARKQTLHRNSKDTAGSTPSNTSKGTFSNTANKPKTKSSTATKSQAGQTKSKEQRPPRVQKSKEQRTSSVESVMETDISTPQKGQREDSDLEEFDIPNKRHRSHKSPQKVSANAVDTNNSFSPLSVSEGEGDELSGAKDGILVDLHTEKTDKNPTNNPSKDKEVTGGKVKLQKNFITPQTPVSSKDEPLIRKK